MKKCAPNLSTMEITATRAKVKLAALMTHTVERIMEMEKDTIMKYLDENNFDDAHLVLLSSWGMGGQKFPSGSSDSDLFVTATTPIRLSLSGDNKNKKIFWLNLAPQSIRFCRPLIIEFIKESKGVVLRTQAEVKKEMAELIPIRIDLPNGKHVLIDVSFIECNNKFYRRNRENHARKCSSQANLQDVFLRSLHASDPLVSSISLEKRLRRKKSTALPEVVKSFLLIEDDTNEDNAMIDELEDIMEELNYVDEHADGFLKDVNLDPINESTN
jgi:hypothetical protein